MKQATILLHSVDDVKRFVRIASQYPYDIDLLSGRYAVDAKSIMGILSLDLSEPIILKAECEDPGDLLEHLTDFLIQESTSFCITER